jgi:hypothetical protein
MYGGRTRAQTAGAAAIPVDLFLDLHRGRAEEQFRVSSLVNDSFPGTFNASGFHERILNLRPGESGYGVDNCLRHLDLVSPDNIHKAGFHMGIYAASIERSTIIDPGKDEEFFAFQAAVVGQFFSFIRAAGVRVEEVSATFFDGGQIGGNDARDRDSLLSRSYRLSTDTGGFRAMAEHIGERMFPVRSVVNIDINPVEGALVGPRIEVAVRGFEIATVVFDYFKIMNGKLMPIEYLGGYAIGMERLQAALRIDGNLYNTGIMPDAKAILDKHVPQREGFYSVTDSPLMADLVRQLLSSTEALLYISRVPEEDVSSSRSRKSIVAGLIGTVRGSARKLGVEDGELAKFVRSFASLIKDSMPHPFSEVHAERVVMVLGLE